MDEKAHKRLTGVSNRRLLDNLRKLSRTGCALAVRVPLVPGCNDLASDLEQMADFCAFSSSHPVHLLPYHRGYSGKVKRLGLADRLPVTAPPAPRRCAGLRTFFCGAS